MEANAEECMDMNKKIALLVLCRRVIAELLIEHIESNTQIKAYGVYSFHEVRDMAHIIQPIVALVEIPERHDDPILEAFNVCDGIQEESPGCKIMLMCPEQDKKSVAACEDAKRNGKIDDYLFYETSKEYLTSKLAALLPA